MEVSNVEEPLVTSSKRPGGMCTGAGLNTILSHSKASSTTKVFHHIPISTLQLVDRYALDRPESTWKSGVSSHSHLGWEAACNRAYVSGVRVI